MAEGLAPTQGSLGLSVATYNWSLLFTAGPAVLAIAVLALLCSAWMHGLGARNLVIGVAASTYVFSIVSLYLGKTIQWNAHTIPVDQWNTRFAISPMLAVALLAGGGAQDLAAWLKRRRPLTRAGTPTPWSAADARNLPATADHPIDERIRGCPRRPGQLREVGCRAA